MTTSPLISIGFLNYNQGKYLDYCLNTVENLNYKNVEYLFADDCSTDDSIEKIKQARISPIHILNSKKNMGTSHNANKYITNSTGDYIAGICCDDGFLPEKLNIQLDSFKTNPSLGAVFTLPLLIDENDNPLPNESDPIFFNKNYSSRFEFLNHFFFYSNFLLGPSMLIKKECYESIGLYDQRYLQLQDYEFYIRLLLGGYEIKLIEQPLTYYRIRDNQQNLSAKPHHSRFIYEITLILKEHFSTINDPITLNKIFPLIQINDIHLMKFDLAMIGLKLNTHWHGLFSLDLLYQLFKNDDVVELIGKERNFYPPNLYALTND